MKECYFRECNEQDMGLVLSFIKKIAQYEKMLDLVKATEQSLHEWIVEKKIAHVFFIMCDNKEVGFALYFYNFSTFVGKAGLYLEDIFIDEEYRHFGFGKKVFYHLSKIAKENNCERFDFVCLDWNEPSLRFYQSLGAKVLNEWKLIRLEADSINKLAEKDQ